MVYALLGTFIMALGVNIGFIPVNLFSTAFPGIGVLTLYTFGISAGLVVFIMNVPLFLLAWKYFGRAFFFKNILVAVSLSVFIDVHYPLHRYVDIPLWLGIVLGGISTGVGVGIIFRQELTSGGVGLLGRLIQLRFPQLKMGIIHVGFDFFVLVLGAILIDVKTAFFTFLASLIVGRSMDVTKEFQLPVKKARAEYIGK